MARVHGVGSFTGHRDVEIPIRGEGDDAVVLRVRLRSLGAGEMEQVERRLPAPVAKSRPLRDKRGPVRDAQTGRVVVQPDEFDPAYLAAKAEVEKLRTYALLELAIDDPGWVFDAQPPADEEPASWEAYYREWRREFDELGIPAGIFKRLAEEIQGTLNLDDDGIEAHAEDRFSPGEG